MPKSPYINAILAGAYIVGIVYLLDAVTRTVAIQQTLLIPIGVLSMLVLSVAVMALLFGYQPFRLYFDGKKDEALAFLLKTVFTFAAFVVAYLAVVVFVSQGGF